MMLSNRQIGDKNVYNPIQSNPIQSNPIQSNSDNYIPYPIRTQITQIEPRLDVFWQEHLVEIMSKISAHDRQNVFEQLLKPKNIAWNGEKQKFEYRGQHMPFSDWIRQIPSNARHIKILSAKLVDALNTLSTYNDISKIADFLENIFTQIATVDVQHSVEQQVWKTKLHSEFVYAVAHIIKNNNELEIPKNYRGLNLPVLKTFICEVFLKHQLLGYWFKTLRNRQLAEMNHPLLSDFLRAEQRIRQLEVVRASKYLFPIAPTLEYSANPFTLRRFLQEDRLFSGEKILFNGVAINTALIAQYDESYQERFRRQIDCIITIESNVSRVLIEYMHQLEDFHDDKLVNLLLSPFHSSQMNLAEEVRKRLREYEQILVENILAGFNHALLHMAKNTDEYGYLYVAMRQLFGSILTVFRDFQTQPAVLMNNDADVLFGRLVAYSTFLEKRYDDIFIEQKGNEWQEASQRSRQPLKKVVEVVKKHINPYQQLTAQLKKQAALLEKPETFLGKLLKSRERQEEKYEEIEQEVKSVAWQVHKEIINLPKEFEKDMVYLEFDSQLITDETLRHYAFPDGNNGITKLPMVLSLPESRYRFRFDEFTEQVEKVTGLQMFQRHIDEEDDD